MVRFVSEFGAQAVPVDAGFCEPDRWPALDWDHLREHHALQKDAFDKYVPPADYATFDAWRAATQRYQATLIKHHIEALRRIKYRPTGGFAHFCFADAIPAVTWSVLGHDRQHKLGFDALAAACQPVIVVADRLPAALTPGAALEADVHVVSDLRQALLGCVVTATLRWADGEQMWRFGGDVGADECVRVGRVTTTVPRTPGPIALVLELDGPVHATNADASIVQPS
jgi:beta-mannosidase